ncbi:alpha/beta-hydrolase [Linnemannia elongata AG-77]|uniref:Carboxylic ester hydrolase n=1 Tax=Linnemannia elongata AG-77 TaxID=1314771 RepID=A0A197JYV5_9FUNG|nr:alpha/beta-hydrolase [Linnemannia elongata AG-77]
MSPPPQINISGCGLVQGTQAETQPSVAKFLNIPYATVPERWRPAVKAAPWTGVRDATIQGPVCHQPSSENPLVSMNADAVDEEDEVEYSKVYSEEHCLNLNIFAPHDQLNSKFKPLIPVMVWIHGGGFKDGSNGMSLYDATNMVAHSVKGVGRPVIVVTINYRLNYFGFLSSAELVQDVQSDKRLSDKNGEKCVGNWGLLDQKIALEWVRDHIEAFGGNPKDVTVFGESAGAASIGYHLTIPTHYGLFQRAILQSGAATTMIAGRPDMEGQRYFNHLCQHFKLNDSGLTGAQKIEQLRKIHAKDLVKAANNGKVGMFIPTIDNVLIHSDPRGWVHDGARYDPNVKAVMLGDCRDEGRMFVPTLGAKNLKRWPRFFARNCPPGQEKEFEAIYGIPKTDAEAASISAIVLSDSVFLYPIHATSRALLDGQPQLEMSRFHFDRPLQIVEDMELGLGAHHAAELPFVFGSDTYQEVFSEAEKELSLRVMEVWILFAWGETSRQHGLKHGQNSLLPSDVGVGGQRKEAIVFTEECTVEKKLVERLDARTLAFWRQSELWLKAKREEQYKQRQSSKGQAKL